MGRSDIAQLNLTERAQLRKDAIFTALEANNPEWRARSAMAHPGLMIVTGNFRALRNKAIEATIALHMQVPGNAHPRYIRTTGDSGNPIDASRLPVVQAPGSDDAVFVFDDIRDGATWHVALDLLCKGFSVIAGFHCRSPELTVLRIGLMMAADPPSHVPSDRQSRERWANELLDFATARNPFLIVQVTPSR